MRIVIWLILLALNFNTMLNSLNNNEAGWAIFSAVFVFLCAFELLYGGSQKI